MAKSAKGRESDPGLKVVWPAGRRWNSNRPAETTPVESVVPYRVDGQVLQVVMWDKRPPDVDARYVPEQGRWVALRAV